MRENNNNKKRNENLKAIKRIINLEHRLDGHFGDGHEKNNAFA